MECLVSFLTRKSKGGVTRSDQNVTAEALRLGRSTDNEVYLSDFRVALHHATIHDRQGNLFVEAQTGRDIRVNGKPAQSARLSVGDKISVGPYAVEVVQAPSGVNLAITVELVEPLGDDFEKLRGRSRLSLAEAGLSKRRLSWYLFLLVGLLFLALPIGAFFYEPLRDTLRDAPVTADQSWKSGDFASAHTFFANDCSACHQKPFVTVRDTACVTCHQQTHPHADPAFYTLPELNETRCATCHKEHNGPDALVRRDDGLCADCHADLDQQVTTNLKNARDFGDDHPEFRATLFRYKGDETRLFDKIRVSLADKPVEESNLKFPHDVHLDEQGIDAPGGERVMVCADCHQPEAGGGIGMQPINMEKHCQECHRLEFEPDYPQRQVPHGRLDQVLYALTEYYGDRALKGGYEDVTAPKIVRNRRRPGERLTREERKIAFQWAQEKALAIGADLFEGRVCSTCHDVKRVREEYPPKWDIRPVRIADQWLPKATFTHAQHQTMRCADCHDAAKSKSSEDVLMPEIASCRDCHGGAHASNKLASTCVDCHGFHIADQFLLGDRRGLKIEADVSGTTSRAKEQ